MSGNLPKQPPAPSKPKARRPSRSDSDSDSSEDSDNSRHGSPRRSRASSVEVDPSSSPFPLNRMQRRAPPAVGRGSFFPRIEDDVDDKVKPVIVKELTDPSLVSEIAACLARYPSKRLESFLHLTEFLRGFGDDICALDFSKGQTITYDKKEFGKGESGHAYRLVVDPRGFAAKAMSSSSMSEIQFHQHLTNYALQRGFPNFPLISRVVKCNECRDRRTYGVMTIDNQLSKIKKEECLLMFSELAEGDATSFFKSYQIHHRPKPSQQECLSFIGQVMMMCVVLEKMGLSHRDLRLDNILYHSEPEEQANAGKWLHYIVDSKDRFIQHTGQLWVLWDCGGMTQNPETFTTDVAVVFSGAREAGSLRPHFPMIEPFFAIVEEVRNTPEKSVQRVVDMMFSKGSALSTFSEVRTADMQIINQDRPYII